MKWPSTPYLSWSPSHGGDHAPVESKNFGNYVITEKLDGECTVMSQEKVHARSEDSRDHPSRHWVKRLWSTIRWDVPDDMYLVGENTYAKHSILYPNMDTYFYLFAIVHRGVVQPWSYTEWYARRFGLQTVPFLDAFSGRADKTAFLQAPRRSAFGPEVEGYVLRDSGTLPLTRWEEFSGKYVRENHVQTDEHWMYQPVIQNGKTDDKDR